MTRGLRQLKTDPELNIKDLTIGIFTDSHGLCDHLQKLWRQDIPVEAHSQDLVAEIVELFKSESKAITINWIPSHMGIGLNEEADKQAELGHKSLETSYIPYTRQWLKKIFTMSQSVNLQNTSEKMSSNLNCVQTTQTEACLQYHGRKAAALECMEEKVCSTFRLVIPTCAAISTWSMQK